MLPLNLEKANFKTVRLHFYPPPERASYPRRPFDLAGLDEVAPGMEIRFDTGAWILLFDIVMGSYPRPAEIVADMQRIYVPSTGTRSWLRDTAQRGKDNEIPAAHTGFPFGVVILRFRSSGIKPLVAMWGQPPGLKGPKAWFTAMRWTGVAERCGLSQLPSTESGMDLAAKVIFDKYNTWIGSVEMHCTSFVIELDESPVMIHFSGDEKDFFGRPFLSVSMAVYGVEMDQGELKERILQEHSTGTEWAIPRLKVRGGGRPSTTPQPVSGPGSDSNTR